MRDSLLTDEFAEAHERGLALDREDVLTQANASLAPTHGYRFTGTTVTKAHANGFSKSTVIVLETLRRRARPVPPVLDTS